MSDVISHEKQERGIQGVVEKLEGYSSELEAKARAYKPLEVNITPKSILRFIYSTNPFYLISSMLVLYAQTTLFKTDDLALNTLIPVGIMAGYVVLLTATAVFIVKAGKVWNDARSIMMCILALLMVLSVSMDSQTLDSLGDGAGWLGGGLIFSLLILETLRRQLKIRLSGNFLSGIYLLLGLFFVYPLVISQLILRFPDDRTPGLIGILLFPVIAALAILFWIPSAMRGREVANDNGTPWTAPRFPWVVAGFLIVCVFFRTYLLTLSFQDARGVGGFGDLETGFGFYMLIPPLLASMILMLEYGKAARSRIAIEWAVFCSLILILLGGVSCIIGNEASRRLSGLIFTQMFNPLTLGFGAAGVFFLYGYLRKLSHFDIGLNLLTFVSMTVAMAHLKGVEWIPAVVGLLIIGLLMIRHSTPLNQVFFIMALLFAGNGCLPSVAYKIPIFLHSCALAVMLVGYFNRDAGWGRFLRGAGALLWFGIFLVAMMILPSENLATGWKFFYLAFMAGSGIAYCLLCRGTFFVVLSCLFAGVGLMGLGTYGYVRFLSRNGGGQVIFWAVLSFAGAVLISLHKGGLLRFGRNRETDQETPRG